MNRLLTILLLWLTLGVTEVAATEVSGSLPVLYVLTDGEREIVSRDIDLTGVYWLDPMGKEGVEALGSKDNPLPLYIRCRGNYTWSFDKKSYHIKLWKKQPMMGMGKNKHFALLAHADDKVGFLRNTVGFELSRRMGLPFTPEQRPVELVINGSYEGLYFLTETIRADENRVEIATQENGETDAEKVKGGWLVEIDNNKNSQQLSLPIAGTDLQWLWVTYHSPDSLSDVQRNYLYNQFYDILQAVYTPDKTSTRWEELIDRERLARFYVIQEIVDHTEAFIGSCYLYKDVGEQQWKFGPVWDFGHAFNSSHSKQKYIYENVSFPVSIIKELATFPRFQQAVAHVWDEFYPAKLEGLEDFMHTFLDEIELAAVYNADRWPAYGNKDVKQTSLMAFTRLRTKVNWLEKQWRPIILSVDQLPADDSHTGAVYDLCGRKINTSGREKGFYMEVQRSVTGRQTVRKIIRR